MLLLPFKPYFFMKAELLMAVTIFSRASTHCLHKMLVL